jgi:metal-responsive CopG/Arc/MetJ family transcriptional regulator
MNYGQVSLPDALLRKIDKYIKKHPEKGFTSRAEVIKSALREFLED